MHLSKRVTLVALAIHAGLAASTTAQEQEHPELGRFSTGPPVSATVGSGPVNDASSMHLAANQLASRVDSTDIRVNQVTSSAQNETSFAVNPNDRENWVGVANDYRNGSVEIGFYTTLDGGSSWTVGTFGIDTGFSFSGDPCVAFMPNGTVVIVGMQYQGAGGSRVTGYNSTDGGLTWTKRFIDLDQANDKPQIDADFSGTFSGSVSTAWDRFGTPAGDPIYASTSTDDGSTWSTGVRISDNTSVSNISPDVAYGSNGALHVMWAERGSNKLAWVDTSLDNGVTWSTDVIVAPFTQVPTPIPGSSFRMFDIFAMDADQTGGPHDGNIYVAYHTWNAGAAAHADIRVATSTDSGATWTQNTLVNDDGAAFDQVFPGVVVDPAGNVNVTFFDRRLDPANFLLWTWVGRSSDGGLTWSNNRASDVGWNHETTDFGGTFIGDYIDIEASDRNVFPFWVDGRSGFDQDVYTDRMNLALSTDVQTIPAGTGGSAQINVNIGPNFGGMTYIVVAGASGTSPGATINGVDIPLNPDAVTDISQILANSIFLQNSIGVLDTSGSALTTFSTVGPRPFLAGMTWNWVALVLDGSGAVVYSTDASSIDF